MLKFRASLEKKTIRKFKYGQESSEDAFNIRELLSRNTSNHVKQNIEKVASLGKKAVTTSLNPHDSSPATPAAKNANKV